MRNIALRSAVSKEEEAAAEVELADELPLKKPFSTFLRCHTEHVELG